MFFKAYPRKEAVSIHPVLEKDFQKCCTKLISLFEIVSQIKRQIVEDWSHLSDNAKIDDPYKASFGLKNTFKLGV